MTRWLDRQNEHAAALENCARGARHLNHRGRAFISPTGGPSAIEMQKESLAAVEVARVQLDEIRLRRPEPA
jgi:hypothetical protein